MCETWLVPGTSSSFVAVDGFELFVGMVHILFARIAVGCICKSCSFVLVEISLPNVAGILLVDMNCGCW